MSFVRPIPFRKRVQVRLMKKALVIILPIIYSVAILAADISDMQVSHNGINYILHNDYTATVGKQKGLSGSVYISDTLHIAGRAFIVTTIGKQAFSACPQVTDIIIPSTIEYVYASAIEGTALFRNKQNWDDNCLYLSDCLVSVKSEKIKKSFVVSAGTRIVASGAFSGSKRLRELTLPEGITSIAPESFLGCSNLGEIHIPQSVVEIGEKAFAQTAIENRLSNWTDGVLYVDCCAVATNKKTPSTIVLKEGTRILADKLFYMNKKIEHIVMPQSLKRVSAKSFANCSSLRDIVIGDSVDNIGSQAFLGCTALEKVKMPSCSHYLGGGVFCNCNSLGAITLPEGIISIPEIAFYNCYSLENINMPSSLEHIGESAFNGCDNLKVITLPVNVKEIGRGCFFQCKSLEMIDMSNCADLSIIPPFFAKRCYSLQRVLLPLKLERIEKEAFSEDCSLEELKGADMSVISIHPKAFSECASAVKKRIKTCIYQK